MKSLVKDFLSLQVHLKATVQIFFAEKKCCTLAHFFGKKMAVVLLCVHLKMFCRINYAISSVLRQSFLFLPKASQKSRSIF